VSTLVALLVGLLAVAFLYWAVAPRRYVPWFRVATMRLRLRLRLHPGRGFMTLPGLWLHWSRSAALRGSSRVRPALRFWQRVIWPSSHAVCLGRAQYRHRLWHTIQENILIIGRSRSGKSGWLAKVLVRFPGAVVSATTKPDLFMLTSGLRARYGRPVFTFDPQRFGGDFTRSTIRFDPVDGCQVPAVAVRRGSALTDAVRTKGAEGDSFWSEQAATQMPALLSAAALRGLDLRAVRRWTLSGDTREPERILRAHGRTDWADSVAQMRGPAERTGATIRMVLNSATKFMDDPAVAECVLPAPGAGFDIPGFLRLQGALYLVADQRSEISPLAPLFACLVTEIHWTACQLAGSMRGQRIDPPLLLMLDECTRICPIPAPALLADSGGRGIMMILAAQGLAQVEERWGKTAGRTVLDTSNQLYVAGIQDPDTLEMASDLCGAATYRQRGDKGHTVDHPVATKAMISSLPKYRALVLRGGMPAPVVTHLPAIWHDWPYRWAKLRHRDVAYLVPAPSQAAHSGLVPVPAGAAPAWTALDTEAADRALAAARAGRRATTPARAVNGNGHNGNGHVHGRQPGPSYPWDKR
jgi:type IV secretion system protein VirD4